MRGGSLWGAFSSFYLVHCFYGWASLWGGSSALGMAIFSLGRILACPELFPNGLGNILTILTEPNKKIVNHKQLSAMDLSAFVSMKNAANRDM